MDIFDNFFTKFAYKFDKGYPDMNNDQDVLLLETLLSKVIGEKFSLEEANLSGAATGYPGPLGAFKKYVVDNPKHDPTSANDMNYTADRDATLLDIDTKEASDNISKGEEFKITIKSEDKVQQVKGGNYVPINYKGKAYLIRTTDIRKPTGKAVEPLAADLSSKEEGVFTSFTPGHPQEGQVVSLFIEGTDDNWEFDYDGKKYQVEYLGEPDWSGKGKPKTDVEVVLNAAPRSELGKDIRISLKAANAMFVENWVIPTRAIQIIGKDELKKEIVDIYNELIAGTLFRKGTTATNLAMFIGTNPNSYSIGGRGSYKLNADQAYEAYLGIEKFGKDSPATANCFFKGQVPGTPAEFIKELVPFTPKTVDEELEDLYLYVRGSNESRGGSLFINRKNIDSPWGINPTWQDALGISESTDKDGNIKYS
jgi:hypothetical protein